MQVQPVTGDVQSHAELEQEGVGRVEQREVDQQTHGGAAVRQHVQHGSELGGWKQKCSFNEAGAAQGGGAASRGSCSHLPSLATILNLNLFKNEAAVNCGHICNTPAPAIKDGYWFVLPFYGCLS